MIVKIANRFTDADWGWWPYVFLRPSQAQEITNQHLAKMSLFYGLTYGVLVVAIRLLRGYPPEFVSICTIMLCMILGFFVFYKFTFAWCWNSRARQLRSDS
jgi:hypothetical protein